MLGISKSPGQRDKKIILPIYFSTLGGIILWLAAIFLAPFLKSRSLTLNILFYDLFSPICHQIPSRSFFCFGSPLAVCGRCLGIYLGFLAGTILYPFLGGFSKSTLPKKESFLLLSLPIALDTLGNFFGLWTTSNWLRLLIGFIWGVLLPFYFILGITDLALHLKKVRA